MINKITCLFPIRKNKVTFVSLESKELEGDFLQIYELIKDKYEVKMVLTKFQKNNLWTNFLYMLNTMKQLWNINRSKVVIINDNNYVISKFKRQGVRVIQVWHAAGAIKKFGNCLDREYRIQNYDYIVANSEFWKGPYSEAFGVGPEQVEVLGMPRLDKLVNEEYKDEMRTIFYRKYPQCQGKKLVLYAPTFRGNIYQGFRTVDMDGRKFVEQLGEDYILLYKFHPLLTGTTIPEYSQCINVSDEILYQLMVVSDMLISDYSSIILDYSILKKKLIFYVPDLDEYQESVGCFIEYSSMPGQICRTTEELIHAVREDCNLEIIEEFRNKHIQYKDGKNTERVAELVKYIICESS